MFISWLDIEVSGYLELLWIVMAINRARRLRDASLKSYVHSTRLHSEVKEAKPQAPAEIKTSEPPRLWALIIGINDYLHPTPELRKLKGAVPDANAVDEYLQKDLLIPDDQIINLRDKDATRANILRAFQRLRMNHKIKNGDPILIYYAGHGSQIPSENGGKVQTLVPVDYLAGKTKPIPDRTVATLINRISEAHGNNITVILDCCHSGSGTRGDDQTMETLARGCEIYPDDVPDDLDADICGNETSTRGMRFAEGFAMKGMKSHVLLAACSANERALEDKQSQEAHGRFTTALLGLFRTVSPNQMTYADVLTKISRIDGQNPQCEGYHRDRILFHAKVCPPTRHYYDVKLQGKVYVLQGGQAHGVSDGAEFTIYSDKKAARDGKPPLAVMVGKGPKIKPFITVLEPQNQAAPGPQFKTPAVAIQTKAGVLEELCIHVPTEPQYQFVFDAIAQEMSEADLHPCKIRVVNEDQAKLGIVSDNEGQLWFNALAKDKHARDHHFTRMPYPVDPNTEDIRFVLGAAAHYNLHLNVNHENTEVTDKIAIEFFPLEEAWDDNGDSILSPVENSNLLREGRIEYVVDKDTKYGMKIANKSGRDLHFSCLFFDHADFSISALVEIETQTQFTRDYNLAEGSVVDIGYGDSEVPPIQSSIAEGLNVTIGYLKFYFTSRVVDLSHVPQQSPFLGSRGLETSRKDVGKGEPPVWGTVRIPVIQKRT